MLTWRVFAESVTNGKGPNMAPCVGTPEITGEVVPSRATCYVCMSCEEG